MTADRAGEVGISKDVETIVREGCTHAFVNMFAKPACTIEPCNCKRAAAAIAKQTQAVSASATEAAREWLKTLLLEILHGNDEHREWLVNKCAELEPSLARTLERYAQARGGRTEGTVEVCRHWQSSHCSDTPQSDFDYSLCRHTNCPIRRACTLLEK